jgi:hypothetical protein
MRKSRVQFAHVEPRGREPMTDDRAPWIALRDRQDGIDGLAEMRCDRCQTRTTVQAGIEAEQFSAVMTTFLRVHRKCPDLSSLRS